MTPKKSTPLATVKTGESHRYEVRKIENGFIVKHSHETPTDYKTHETFHSTEPKLFVTPQPIKPPQGEKLVDLPKKEGGKNAPVKAPAGGKVPRLPARQKLV